ncbi:DUF72 domain-containing protein [Brevibacillus dissolubilis]|uniref:DUF72 domain-containing protein n=1 Tax=Brevibacillus dissolubilis TaxID=1844116 RepID=UPI0011162329|nr:DUF72 domain-containing protein [Brevibacillus dissolubilis]
MSKQNIHIGVCGWGDHDTLYTQGVSARDKLSVYASHFPIVEIDSSFYAILPQKNYESWVKATPDAFRFIVKPHQVLTGHQRNPMEKEKRAELFVQFEESIQPLVRSGKLQALLFQFPPWFDCQRDHVLYVKYCVQTYAKYPIAVEFRHQSWFLPSYKQKTLEFLADIGATHVVCDEPQAGTGSVPIVPEVTNESLSLIRFHGRNVSGWRDAGQAANWRDVRYLYRYSDDELSEWVPRIQSLAEEAKQVFVLFNNNSGGDAADNAKRLMQMLGIDPEGLNPRQLELF